LNYELDMYMDAIKSFPKADTKLYTEKGMAYHIKTDVFKRQMWFAYEGGIGGGLIALDPERVRAIIELNKDKKKPHDLKEFVDKIVVKEPDYSNVVGQDDLNRFDSLNKKKKKHKKKPTGSGPRPEQNTANTPRPEGDRKPNPNQNRKPNPNQNRKPNPRPVEAKDGETKNSPNPRPEGQAPKRKPNKRRKPNPRPDGPQSTKSEE